MNIENNKTSLSVIIISQDEEASIEDCLQSVKWADEIVVVDSGSADKTIEICQSYRAKFSSQTNWLGFGVQKNRALALASGKWILSIDADERVTPELQKEILEIIKNQPANTAFYIPRKSSYCGKFIHNSGWTPDYVLRLFPKQNAKFTDDLVHERVVFDGVIKKLKHPLLHLSYTSLEEVLEKTNRYSSDGAQMMRQRGKKSSLSKAIFHGFWAFFRTYIIKLGFLDGRMGLILAISNAETTYYRYLKLMMLSDNKNKN